MAAQDREERSMLMFVQNLLGDVFYPCLLLLKVVAEENQAPLPRVTHKKAVANILGGKKRKTEKVKTKLADPSAAARLPSPFHR